MNKEGIIQILDQNPEMREKLFARGFVFTNSELDMDEYPFYGLWSVSKIREYSLAVSPKQTCYTAEQDESTITLVGHAYNPFSMQADESMILEELLRNYTPETIANSSSEFWKTINELTGVFTIIIIDGEAVYIIGDASGMQTVFYTVFNEKVFVTTHTNLIGDLLNLAWDPYVERLAHYRFFKLLGNSLPGNLTQFQEVKRLIPNHYVYIHQGITEVIRFYWPHRIPKTNEQIADKVAELMHANLELISKKWKKPAISMTGGCDSKTTLACANGIYDKFRYFSYVSTEAEKVDAEAAKQICNELGLKHTIYTIPETDDNKAAAEIINWNTGNIRYSHPNDVRKRVYFANIPDFDVEVKSWASEIGRAYYSKRFNGRKKFGKMTPRKCTTLYKFFFHDRKLVRDTDYVFAEYTKQYFQQNDQDPIEWQEQFFWEFRVPSWNGLVITGEHRYSFDITIPYNNRRILELLLSASVDDRIRDEIYKRIRNRMNPAIDQTGVTVTNLKHTKNRGKAENLYYILHSKLIIL